MKIKTKIFFGVTLALSTSFFIFNPTALLADDEVDDLVISFIEKDGEKGDLIVLCNPTEKNIELKSYRLYKDQPSFLDDKPLKSWLRSSDSLSKHAVLSWFNDDITRNSSSLILAKESSDNTRKIVDKVSFEAKNSAYSLSFHRNLSDCHKDESGDSNDDADDDVNPGDIIINELLPHPNKEQVEFIEIFNSSKKDIDLKNWTLEDSSKKGNFTFSKTAKIKSKDYYLLKRKADFAFALNDSGTEKISLKDKHGNLMDEISYSGSHLGFAYAFSKDGWRWTSHITPGKENQFEKNLRWSAKVPQRSFKKMGAVFEIKVNKKDKKKLKVTWDFGDGHKSYLPKVKHVFKKNGAFTVKLKIWDGSQEFNEEYPITVKKYPESRISIIALSPNPVGKDSGNEWIKIKNNSKKKVNLKDWYIATGGKKLYRHLIKKDLKLKPSEEKIINSRYASITLNNQKSAVALVMPNGKVLNQIKYIVPQKNSEGAVFLKNNGHWEWQIAVTKKESETPKLNTIKDLPVENKSIEPALTDNSVYSPSKNNDESSENASIEEESPLKNAPSDSPTVKFSPLVLGTETSRKSFRDIYINLTTSNDQLTSFKESFFTFFKAFIPNNSFY